ncbi:MAG: hypothetical protein K0S78_6084 [Thermomicrobiales bacterium]|nr:hypothetical protein [Thermomicrobiales bacterium]
MVERLFVGVACLGAEAAGQSTGGVVAGGEHHAVKQVLDGECFSWLETDLAGELADQVRFRSGNHLVRSGRFDGFDRGEHLGDAGRGALFVGTALGVDLAGLGVDGDVVGGGDLQLGDFLG